MPAVTVTLKFTGNQDDLFTFLGTLTFIDQDSNKFITIDYVNFAKSNSDFDEISFLYKLKKYSFKMEVVLNKRKQPNELVLRANLPTHLDSRTKTFKALFVQSFNGKIIVVPKGCHQQYLHENSKMRRELIGGNCESSEPGNFNTRSARKTAERSIIGK
ncbi:MAG: hypothetical protein JWM20_5 [Patescibacteria group bacterium]|nr:hypothetical protein [Patescibacteria group bacterium]